MSNSPFIVLSFLLAATQADIQSRIDSLLNNPLTGLPKFVTTSPPTVATAKLGRLLFYDKRLSIDKTVSCASCHLVESAFSSNTAVSTGVGGAIGIRKAPVILNLAFSKQFFWDGRSSSLEDQVVGPLFAKDEMGNNEENVLATLNNIKGYSPLFFSAFGDGQITLQRISQAIADFERTLLSGSSRYDLWKENSSSHPFTQEEERGHDLFFDRECRICHVPPFFTDDLFHNTGVAFVDGKFKDRGRFGFTETLGQAKDEEMGAFKTPTLRNITQHGPFMHDGSMKTLEEVVEFYNKGGRPNPALDPEMIPLGFKQKDKTDLIAFLNTLTGTGYEDAPVLQQEFPQ